MSCCLGMDLSLTGSALSHSWSEGGTVKAQVLEEIGSRPADLCMHRVQRYEVMTSVLLKWVDKLNPELVVIEGYAFGSGSGKSMDRGEFGGIVRWELYHRGIQMVEVTPTQLKKFLTGKGNADKSHIISVLSREYDREFFSDNKADSFGLALLGGFVAGYGVPERKSQVQAVEAVKALLEQETQPWPVPRKKRH